MTILSHHCFQPTDLLEGVDTSCKSMTYENNEKVQNMLTISPIATSQTFPLLMLRILLASKPANLNVLLSGMKPWGNGMVTSSGRQPLSDYNPNFDKLMGPRIAMQSW